MGESMKKLHIFILLTIFAALALGAESTPPTWFSSYCIDNANQSGCASDSNDGTTCVCTGGGTHHGPLKTWSELYVNRLGCGGYGMCPRYTAGHGISAVTYTFLSSDTSEYINFETLNVGAMTVGITCTLGVSQTIGAGVLSNFSARNRTGVVPGAVGSGLYKAAIAGVTLAQNEIVFDATNVSYFWPYYDITTSGGAPGSGDTWAFSQPFAPVSSTEVVIASGDAVTVYLPPTIQANNIHSYPVNTGGGGGIGNNTVITDCSFGGSDGTSVNANNGIAFYQDAFLSNAQITPGFNGLTILLNDSAPTSAVDVNNSTAGFGGQQNYILGGIYGSPGTGSQNCLTCNGCQMDGDLIFGQTPGAYAGSITTFVGQAYVDVNNGLLIYPGTQVDFTQSLYNAGHPVLWGGGTLDIANLAGVQYPIGAGKAASTFTQKGAIGLFSAGTLGPACYLNTTTGVQTCNLPVTQMQLDTTLGTVAGCFTVPGGAAICN
jgi:hypothetical protein